VAAPSLRSHRETSRRELRLELSPAPSAPWRGRRALERLSDVVGPGRLADLELIASELIANSVVHAGLGEGALVRMRVDVSDTRVRIEVEDPGSGFAPRPVPASGDRGRGLTLVDRVASRWGIARTGTTLVWAEIDRDRGSRAAAR
jgi:anti-sigma regulatory factor (Ser/Thr protein kinase)